MGLKEKYELEFTVKSSSKVLFNFLSTPSGLSEWFADDINIKKDIYIFIWEGSEERAKLVSKKNNEYIRFQWLDDEEDDPDAYFEMRVKIDPLTRSVALIITDFAEPDEMEESKNLWAAQIDQLKHNIGG